MFKISLKMEATTEIRQLSQLASQQLSILGYIQIDGQSWYLKKRINKSGEVPSPGPDQILVENKSAYIILTSNPDEGKRAGISIENPNYNQ